MGMGWWVLVADFGFGMESFIGRSGDSHKGYGLTVYKRPSKSSLAKSTSTQHHSFPAYVASHLHYWIKAETAQ